MKGMYMCGSIPHMTAPAGPSWAPVGDRSASTWTMQLHAFPGASAGSWVGSLRLGLDLALRDATQVLQAMTQPTVPQTQLLKAIFSKT